MFQKLSVVLAALFFLSLHATSSMATEERTWYSMPLPGPAYGAPPRPYYDSTLLNITFKTTPEVLQKLVPKPMVPNPESIVTVYFGHFNTPDYRSGQFQFQGGSYDEVGLVVPVTLLNKTGGYSLFMYLNKPGPAISGREIWGFPKKDADIAMTEENGKTTWTVQRLGVTLMKATFAKGEKIEPVPARPARLRYNLKYIPSAKRNAPPDVMQITSYVQESKIKEIRKGRGTLEFGSTSVDPLGEIPIVKIINTESLFLDGAVDYGDVVFDYLKQGKEK